MKRAIMAATIGLVVALSYGTAGASQEPKFGKKGYIVFRNGVQLSFLLLSIHDTKRIVGKRVTVYGYIDDSFRGTGTIINWHFKIRQGVFEGQLNSLGFVNPTKPDLDVIMSGRALINFHSLSGEDEVVRVGDMAQEALKRARGGKALLEIKGTIYAFQSSKLYLSARSIKVLDQR